MLASAPHTHITWPPAVVAPLLFLPHPPRPCTACLPPAAAWRIDDYLGGEEEDDDLDLSSLRRHTYACCWRLLLLPLLANITCSAVAARLRCPLLPIHILLIRVLTSTFLLALCFVVCRLTFAKDRKDAMSRRYGAAVLGSTCYPCVAMALQAAANAARHLFVTSPSILCFLPTSACLLACLP
jgi:hypothetical protein